MSKYFTTAEAASFLNVTPARVRQFIIEGRLASIKMGRDHLIAESTLKNFADSGRKNIGRPSKKPLRER
ncbi:MAG: hypothetical protein A2Y11_03495 [Planctomycetes bacterium GWC2_39_26]|nr:MAG: hypothetical protein A2Y11_03495 [Planctomycetes bacterium GWC2_39_26]